MTPGAYRQRHHDDSELWPLVQELKDLSARLERAVDVLLPPDPPPEPEPEEKKAS